jgi:hypothetical protein
MDKSLIEKQNGNFANTVLAAVFFSLIFSNLENNLKIYLKLFANSK